MKTKAVPIYSMPAIGHKFTIKFKSDVQIIEWNCKPWNTNPVGEVVNFSLNEEMNVFKVTETDKQKALYLRTPWNSTIYLLEKSFEVINGS